MIGGMVQLGLLVMRQESIVQQADAPVLAAPPAPLQEAAVAPGAFAEAGAYPEKPRDRQSPWGCAAFDVDNATPPPLDEALAQVTIAPRPGRAGYVGYRLVAGEATDTLIPDIGYFGACLENGVPEQVIETPAQRSTAGHPASRWAMEALELDAVIAIAAGAPRPAQVRLEVARSRPDMSPYVEALPVEEPFGAIWLLDHGAAASTALTVSGQVYPALCEGLEQPGQRPRFARVPFDAAGAPEGRPADEIEPRRRLFDLSAELGAIPAAAAMQAWRACTGPDCETQSAFAMRNQALAAANFCDLDGGVWRVRVDARLTAPNAADALRPYHSTLSALVQLEPPGPLTAAPLYRAPPAQAMRLRVDGEGYALSADVQQAEAQGGGYRVRLRIAAPSTSHHLIRMVALDDGGVALGASRWTHVLAFVPQAAAPVSITASPAVGPAAPVTRAAASGEGRFAAADDAQAPLPNP
jgi:hypothetical protein